jgi:hypothetical protein
MSRSGSLVRPQLDVQRWLAARPRLRRSMALEAPGGAAQAYDAWPAWVAAELAAAVQRVALGAPSHLRDPPPPARLPEPAGPPVTVLHASEALAIYLGHVANSLVLEMQGALPWSLEHLSDEGLADLLDGRTFFRRVGDGYALAPEAGQATPGDPRRALGFLRARGLVAPTPLETVARLLAWCRDNLRHFRGPPTSETFARTWGYPGFPPVRRLIEDRTPGGAHVTAGCWGTAGLLRALLRTVNVPARVIEMEGHAQVRFASLGLFLAHGDDPYSGIRAVPEAPVLDLLLDEREWRARFGPDIPAETHALNLGRRPVEVAVRHLSNSLLQARCHDLLTGTPTWRSDVLRLVHPFFSRADLLRIGLWERLDRKVAAVGGRGAVARLPA